VRQKNLTVFKSRYIENRQVFSATPCIMLLKMSTVLQEQAKNSYLVTNFQRKFLLIHCLVLSVVLEKIILLYFV